MSAPFAPRSPADSRQSRWPVSRQNRRLGPCRLTTDLCLFPAFRSSPVGGADATITYASAGNGPRSCYSTPPPTLRRHRRHVVAMAAAWKDHTVVGQTAWHGACPRTRGRRLRPVDASRWTSAAVLHKLGIDRPDIVATKSADGRVCIRGAYPEQDNQPGSDDSPIPGIPPWKDSAVPGCGTSTFRRPGRRAAWSPAARASLPRHASGTSSRATRRKIGRSERAATTPRATQSPDAIPLGVRPVSRNRAEGRGHNLKARRRKKAGEPVLAIGARKAFGALTWPSYMRKRRRNVQEVVVPNVGH